MKVPRTIDKAEARERRDKLNKAASRAELSITQGIREMRAISGMTQDEFASHRGVSARALKALELGQGNPTVATLNRIAEFYGLEVAFVPIRKVQVVDKEFSFDPIFDIENRSLNIETVSGGGNSNIENYWEFLEKSRAYENAAARLAASSILEENLKAVSSLTQRLKKVENFNEQLKKAEATLVQMEKARVAWTQIETSNIKKVKKRTAGGVAPVRKPVPKKES